MQFNKKHLEAMSVVGLNGGAPSVHHTYRTEIWIESPSGRNSSTCGSHVSMTDLATRELALRRLEQQRRHGAG